ncbi:MAG: Lrp/AsnC family transcriptional regulator [Candidatus Diapherotrites archaeon]|nr:Lrp/AsnC family transcriptional regulator [Candidatus Diapherotrites archaeon]
MRFLDETDRKIIRLLQEDSRESFKAIAKKLKMSDATIHNRVKNLLKEGIIRKFTLSLDAAKAGYPVLFSISLEVEPQKLKEAAEKLAVLDEVYSVWIATGTNNLQARARAEDLQKLQRMSNEVITSLPGVRKVEISLATGVLKDEKEVHI